MTTEIVRQATDDSFDAAVLDRSHEVPVVVDFWAPWCGPCRVIGPIIDALATEFAGRVDVVKLNVDENPLVARKYGISSIPAVKAFKDGRVASEFLGAVPAPQVRKFFESLAPTRIDQLVAEAARMKADGNAGAARMHLEAALQQEPGHERATMALVAMLMQDGEVDRAAELLERWEGDPRFARVMATLNFRRAIEGVNREALEARLAANPEDAAAHYSLGCLLAAAGEWEPALEHLLATVRLDRKVADDGGRKRLLDAFVLLGDAHPLTDEYRRRLMNVLF